MRFPGGQPRKPKNRPMDNEAAFKLMEKAMHARQDAHRAETSKSLADVMLECRKWIADEAADRAKDHREAMREGRATAINIGLGLAGLIVVGFLGLAGLILRIPQGAVAVAGG